MEQAPQYVVVLPCSELASFQCKARCKTLAICSRVQGAAPDHEIQRKLIFHLVTLYAVRCTLAGEASANVLILYYLLTQKIQHKRHTQAYITQWASRSTAVGSFKLR